MHQAQRPAPDLNFNLRRGLVPDSWLLGGLGGVLIGLSSAMVLLGHGRIAGISGIVRRSLVEGRRDRLGWRRSFVAGLVLSGLIAQLWGKAGVAQGGDPWLLGLSGLAVGFGTQLGSGCTSGHGVCGLGRGSARSLVAVLVFLGAGMLTVFLHRHWTELGV